MSTLATRSTPIPSIPTVPQHWLLRRNKTFMRELNLPSKDGNEEMLSVSHLTGVTPRSEKTVYMFEAESTVGYKLVRPGDLVINTMWAWMGAAGVSRSSGIVSPAYGVYELDQTQVDPRWIDLLIRTLAYVTEMTRFSRGVTSSRLRLYPDEFLRLFAPLPPLGEQRAIADCLEAETARIDALVTRKGRMIELLEEHRQTITLLGATGTAPDLGFSTREASVPWTPQVAEGFDEVLLRLVAVQGTGHTPSRDHPEWWVPDECVIPWVTTGEVQQVRSDEVEFIHETREQVSPAGIENSSAEVHPAGTVFLCRTASAGYSGIMGTDMATSQDFATWTCGPLLRPRYLLLCLRAMRADLLGRLATGSTHKTIYMPDIQALRIPLPSIPEQDRIVKWVRDRLDRSFAATRALHRQTSLLEEHRQALITAAVTGELEVSKAA